MPASWIRELTFMFLAGDIPLCRPIWNAKMAIVAERSDASCACPPPVPSATSHGTQIANRHYKYTRIDSGSAGGTGQCYALSRRISYIQHTKGTVSGQAWAAAYRTITVTRRQECLTRIRIRHAYSSRIHCPMFVGKLAAVQASGAVNSGVETCWRHAQSV